MKKGQITVFIILGIVIFTIIALLFYLKSSVETQEFTAERAEIEDLFTTQGKYSGYMQACLDTVTNHGIALVGMQGGVIYEHQASSTKPFLGPRKYDYGQYVLPFEYDDIYDLYPNSDTVIFNVSYGIYAPDLEDNTAGHPNIPEYPYGLLTLVQDPSKISKTFTNVFGNVIRDPMPPLCDYNGANSPLQKKSVYSCETYDSQRQSDNDNIQEYLEAYITEAFETCVDLESLPEFSNTSITAGNITVELTMAPTSMTVKADYPIVATTHGEQATLSLQTFHTMVNVRLQQIHELTTRLIDEDVNNIFFNIVRDANELTTCKEPGSPTESARCLKEGMEIVKYRDICQQLDLCKKYGQYDDVVAITDEESIINGKPFMYVFAIQNRVPTLDYIYNDASLTEADYDWVVTAGDDIKISPYGYDPDEDQHSELDFMESRYIYALWKEDYDEPYGADRDINPAADRFTTSSLWTTAASPREASYTTDPGDYDKGSHTLQVQICDNEGLCDYQNVRILVK
jgi:hypothetical protein